MLEQNNFAISEFINNKKAESNYEPIKNRVRDLIIFNHLLRKYLNPPKI